MDKRKAELDETKKICQFLCNSYPKFFEMTEYTHPVKGACNSMILKTYDNAQVDIANIDNIVFQLDDNRISITTEMPQRVYTFNKFIEDATVM